MVLNLDAQYLIYGDIKFQRAIAKKICMQDFN